ncbi:MAG: hypothetical protein KDA52_01515 [Planctomycetaceae bacterium]|nr:hypothetical protein [Planctomycetaceae bacterium]
MLTNLHTDERGLSPVQSVAVVGLSAIVLSSALKLWDDGQGGGMRGASLAAITTHFDPTTIGEIGKAEHRRLNWNGGATTGRRETPTLTRRPKPPGEDGESDSQRDNESVPSSGSGAMDPDDTEDTPCKMTPEAYVSHQEKQRKHREQGERTLLAKKENGENTLSKAKQARLEEARKNLERLLPAGSVFEVIEPYMTREEKQEYLRQCRQPPNCVSYVLGVTEYGIDPRGITKLCKSEYVLPPWDQYVALWHGARALFNPYGFLDEALTHGKYHQTTKTCFGPRIRFSECTDQSLLPPGTILAYSNGQLPSHVAILNSDGIWESRTGVGEPVIRHVDPESLPAIAGKPTYYYLPIPCADGVASTHEGDQGTSEPTPAFDHPDVDFWRNELEDRRDATDEWIDSDVVEWFPEYGGEPIIEHDPGEDLPQEDWCQFSGGRVRTRRNGTETVTEFEFTKDDGTVARTVVTEQILRDRVTDTGLFRSHTELKLTKTEYYNDNGTPRFGVGTLTLTITDTVGRGDRRIGTQAVWTTTGGLRGDGGFEADVSTSIGFGPYSSIGNREEALTVSVGLGEGGGLRSEDYGNGHYDRSISIPSLRGLEKYFSGASGAIQSLPDGHAAELGWWIFKVKDSVKYRKFANCFSRTSAN